MEDKGQSQAVPSFQTIQHRPPISQPPSCSQSTHVPSSPVQPLSLPVPVCLPIFYPFEQAPSNQPGRPDSFNPLSPDILSASTFLQPQSTSLNLEHFPSLLPPCYLPEGPCLSPPPLTHLHLYVDQEVVSLPNMDDAFSAQRGVQSDEETSAIAKDSQHDTFASPLPLKHPSSSQHVFPPQFVPVSSPLPSSVTPSLSLPPSHSATPRFFQFDDVSMQDQEEKTALVQDHEKSVLLSSPTASVCI